jgi:hypothetical protein
MKYSTILWTLAGAGLAAVPMAQAQAQEPES